MANANPSRPGVNVTAGKLEINVPKDVAVVRKRNGEIVRRTEFTSGTVRETQVFAGDHENDANIVDEAAPKPKAPAKAGK